MNDESRSRAAAADQIDPPIEERPTPCGRRRFVATGAVLGLAACTGLQPAVVPVATPSRTTPTIDLHSHAGHVIPSRFGGRPLTDVKEQMRAGGMDVICLAVVADTPVTRVEGRVIRAWRDPEPGELYAWSLEAQARVRELVERDRLGVVVDRASLLASIDRPSVIVASEGADFLEGRIERVDACYETFDLRHLQLTHYRVNELGDIQTAPPVHGGLTAFGRAVVRRCNARGIVVDVAHAPLATVRGVIEASDRPVVLSHTSLQPSSAAAAPFSRLISPAHARLVASTGGVIGVWPPASRFPSLAALARGMRDLVDVVGVEHVGLGSDMLGLTGPSTFTTYADLPGLETALRAIGFAPHEVALIAGGNYARVFLAVIGR